ncbi:MAG: hypothetical protein ACRC37_03590 [Lentisphaeria bacterium]
MDLAFLNGKKFCVVFAKYIDELTEKVQLRCHHGRANVADKNQLFLIEDLSQARIGVPSSAYNKILPSDGSELLKDSEYFVIVKVDKNIEF